MNFHSRWRWWDGIQAIFLNLFYFTRLYIHKTNLCAIWWGFFLCLVTPMIPIRFSCLNCTQYKKEMILGQGSRVQTQFYTQLVYKPTFPFTPMHWKIFSFSLTKPKYYNMYKAKTDIFLIFMLINFLVQRTEKLIWNMKKQARLKKFSLIFLAAQLAQTIKFCSQMWIWDRLYITLLQTHVCMYAVCA